MKRRHHTPEQIIRKVAEGQKLLAEGRELAEVGRYLEVTPATSYRWVSQYGGMKGEDAKRLRREPAPQSMSGFSGSGGPSSPV